MSRNKYVVGEKVKAVPMIVGKATTFQIVSIVNTDFGKVYHAVDLENMKEYKTRPMLNDDSKFWDAEQERSCFVYKVRRERKK